MKTNTELYDNPTQNKVTVQNGELPDKKASWEHVQKLFEGMSLTDEDVVKARDERLR